MGGLGLLRKVATSTLVSSLPLNRPIVLGAVALWSLVQDRLSKKGSSKKRGKDGDGKESGVSDSGESLEWAELSCTLEEKEGTSKHILQSAVGIAGPGRLVAIMGPSGSGKTTLLTAIAGRMPKTKGMTLEGTVLCGGGSRIGFVQQDDCFYSQLTVAETLNMAASFQLPKGREEEREKRVQEVLKKLGLTKCADTIVGDNKTRGISGGEKKRLSIGIELLSDPGIILADEPTTGLDSFQAEKVMRVLHSLAKGGRIVLCTIHQPKASIFSFFDDVVLLTEGRTVFSGSVNQARELFASRELACPAETNLAEFFLDSISIDDDSAEACRERIDGLVSAFSPASAALAKSVKAKGTGKGASAGGGHVRSGILTQLKILYLRSFRQVARDKATNVLRAVTNVNSAIVFGSIYWRLRRTQVRLDWIGSCPRHNTPPGPTHHSLTHSFSYLSVQSTIQDRFGLLQVTAINTAMSSITKTLTAFSREKVIVDRERSRNNYHIGPYFAAKLLAEVPVSAVFPLLFGAVVYPLCGLNPTLKNFGSFLGLITVESIVSSSIGLSVGSLVGSPEAANALGPGKILLPPLDRSIGLR